MCFTFEIPADIDYNDVDAAELWVYRQPDPTANEAQSFLVSEIESWDSKKINKPLAIHYANSSGMYRQTNKQTKKRQTEKEPLCNLLFVQIMSNIYRWIYI